MQPRSKFQRKRQNTRKHLGRRLIGFLNEEETRGCPEVLDGLEDGAEDMGGGTQRMEGRWEEEVRVNIICRGHSIWHEPIWQ
jgi:hypothetical protein